MRRIMLCVLAVMIMGAAVAEAAEPGAFAKGRKRVGFYGGAGTTLDQTYFILGAGAGYYLADGLEVGLDFEGWLFEDPTITKLTPQIRYVFWQPAKLKPYVGAFWRQTWISGAFSDYSSWGGRAGVAYASGRNYVALGVVHERFDEDMFADSSATYPEFAIWISF